MNPKYEKIIGLKHYKSQKRKPMARLDRAAQFAPFAALTGYEDCIQESKRYVEEKIELGSDDVDLLNQRLQILTEEQKHFPMIKVTYFKKDDKKEGGAYYEKSHKVRKIDDIERTIEFMDRTKIFIDDILQIECDLFEE